MKKDLRTIDDIANDIKKRRREKAAGVVTVETQQAKKRHEREAALAGDFVGQLAERDVPQIARRMLGFRFDGHFWRAQPQRPFYPCGLVICGELPTGAVLEQSVISQQMQVLVSADPVPAKFFSTWQSYEQIAAALDKGAEPPNWCTWDLVHVGCCVLVSLRTGIGGEALGPEQGVLVGMWGETIVI